MSISSLIFSICFVVCHGGAADHFATFAEDLLKKGYEVDIYAGLGIASKGSSGNNF